MISLMRGSDQLLFYGAVSCSLNYNKGLHTTTLIPLTNEVNLVLVTIQVSEKSNHTISVHYPIVHVISLSVRWKWEKAIQHICTPKIKSWTSTKLIKYILFHFIYSWKKYRLYNFYLISKNDYYLFVSLFTILLLYIACLHKEIDSFKNINMQYFP